jgi:hypothetical protein
MQQDRRTSVKRQGNRGKGEGSRKEPRRSFFDAQGKPGQTQMHLNEDRGTLGESARRNEKA